MNRTEDKRNRLIDINAASDLTGMCRSRIYSMIANGEFVQPVKIGRSTRFVEGEVDAWIRHTAGQREPLKMSVVDAGE